MKHMVIPVFFTIVTLTNLAEAQGYERPRIGILLNTGVKVHEQIRLGYQLTLPDIASGFDSSSVAGIKWTPHQAIQLQFLFGGTHQPKDNTWIVSFRPMFLIKKFFVFCLFNYNVNFTSMFYFVQAGHPITQYLGLSLVTEGVVQFRDVMSSWVTVGPSVDIKFTEHVTISAINMVGVERGRVYYVFRAYLQFNF